MAKSNNERGTGLDKFLGKQFSDGIKIGTPTNEARQRERAVEDVKENVPEIKSVEMEEVQEVQPAVRKRGRPAVEGEEKATIIIKVDRELKKKLDEVKYKTYKSTMRDVLIEAIVDICKKYDVE